MPTRLVDKNGNEALWSSSGAGTVTAAATVADGADATQGITTGAKVITDANGTVQQYLRGLVYFALNGVATIPTYAAATNASSTVYATSLVIKASAGRLYGLSGYNSKGSAQFIQLHDATALPSDTAVPKVVFTVAASSNFSIDFGPRGRSFTTGIVAANSSTGPTLTVGSADVWFDAQLT